MNDNKYLRLPNSNCEIIEHPNGTDNAIDIGLVKDHRFVFYFWFKWWKNTKRRLEENVLKAPTLITIDWHRDLCAPCDIEKQDLIGDVYVLCKQDGSDDGTFTDHWGNEHKIICFESKEELFEELLRDNINEIYFDIDLDYFTESEDPCGGGDDLTLMDDKDIISLLDINSNFMQWIFQRMEGMTIATEPKWCGGLKNSNKIYDLVDNTLFDFQLFSKHAKWKHLN